MATREEIGEVIWEFLIDYDKDNSNPAVDWAFILLHRLHDKGVVVKVEREFKDFNSFFTGVSDLPYEEKIEKMKKFIKALSDEEAGYEAVIPLILRS